MFINTAKPTYDGITCDLNLFPFAQILLMSPVLYKRHCFNCRCYIASN